MFEWAWAQTERFRNIDEKRDSQYPHFRRTDVKHWTRWKLYPGALLFMPTRLLLLGIDGFLCTIIVKVLTLGHDFKRGPLKDGCRKKLLFFMYKKCTSLYLFIAGIRTKKKQIDSDYSEYLGRDYRTKMRKIKKTSTIVCNHISWLDTVVLIDSITPAFSPTAGLKDIPLLNTLIDVLDSIYIPRGGSKESREFALEQIRIRQGMIE